MFGSQPSTALLITAASVALLHTLVGFDHVLPFVLLGRAQRWTMRRTLGVTALCAIAHVIASVVLGIVGILAGAAMDRLLAFDAGRANVEAWLLIGFGLAYAAWAFWRQRRHHIADHADMETRTMGTATVWTLFIIFAFGPCEALIPLLMAPAVSGNFALVGAIVGLFGAVTLVTMVGLVALGSVGLRWYRIPALERYVHVIAGLGIAIAGGAVRLVGA